MTNLGAPAILTTDYDRRIAAQIVGDWGLTPATFAHRISRGSWIPAKHLQYISLRVAKAIARGNGRIIISAPPRHGKSQLTSIYVPAWILERFPQYRTILTGYGAELVTGFSRQVRDIFTDKDNFNLLKTRLRRDATRVEAFLTEQGGGMYAVGLGGAITGRGANVLLIDDYIKEIKEALSPAYRDYLWNWFTTTAFTRLEPGGSCIIIATRWHSDDLIGRILQNFPGQWEYIELPAVIETEEQLARDVIGRKMGDVLFEERYPIDRLDELKDTLGNIFWQALFQQKPVDEATRITDSAWLNQISAIPEEEMDELRWMRIWDFAATDGGGDYTCGSLCAYNKRRNKFYITNIIRDQMSPGQVEEKIYNTALADGAGVEVHLEQEPGASGKSLVEYYTNAILKDFTVSSYPATNQKLVRAQPMLAAAEAGKVYIVGGAWNESFKREFDSFPGGAYDDQVDTVSAGYQKLSGKKVFTASWGRTVKNSSSANSRELQRAQYTSAIGHPPTKIRGATFGRRVITR